jgi:hypothetical protein
MAGRAGAALAGGTTAIGRDHLAAFALVGEAAHEPGYALALALGAAHLFLVVKHQDFKVLFAFGTIIFINRHILNPWQLL